MSKPALAPQHSMIYFASALFPHFNDSKLQIKCSVLQDPFDSHLAPQINGPTDRILNKL
jgi:hypothetical protein